MLAAIVMPNRRVAAEIVRVLGMTDHLLSVCRPIRADNMGYGISHAEPPIVKPGSGHVATACRLAASVRSHARPAARTAGWRDARGRNRPNWQ
jgi:hypothetical protein